MKNDYNYKSIFKKWQTLMVPAMGIIFAAILVLGFALNFGTDFLMGILLGLGSSVLIFEYCRKAVSEPKSKEKDDEDD